MYTQYFLPLKVSTASMQGVVYAPYRFSFDANNQSQLNVNHPEFMPVFGPDVPGASVEMNIASQYLEPTTWENYWIPNWGMEPGWMGNDWLYRSGAD
jgi:hypothetical protein